MVSRKLVLNFFVLISFQVSPTIFAQDIIIPDSLEILYSVQVKRPKLNYNIENSFTYIPRFGSVAGLTFSPNYSYQFSPKISFEAGLIAGRYYSNLKYFDPDFRVNNYFNLLSLYGSAIYHINEKLNIYGAGTKQLKGSMPLYNIPNSSLTFGSTLSFGNFTLNAAIQISDWNNYYSPYPYRGDNICFPSLSW